MTSEISTRLAARRPADTDTAILSQASRLGVGLRARYKTIFPRSGGSYDLVTGFDVSGSLGEVQAVLRSLEMAATPAEVRDIEGWLAELSVITVPRKNDDMAGALTLTAYASRLAQYPADVARAALLESVWKFWPTWEELKSECDRLAAPRRHMDEALRRPATDEPAAASERISGDRATELMHGAGFTPKRFEQVERRPMARTADELEGDDTNRVPHWTETADPDGPEMKQLREARDNNPLIQAARARQASFSQAAE